MTTFALLVYQLELPSSQLLVIWAVLIVSVPTLPCDTSHASRSAPTADAIQRQMVDYIETHYHECG